MRPNSTDHTPREVWVTDSDVDAPISEGRIVRATHDLSNWTLRRFDGGEPIATGTLLVITETRSHAAMAREMVGEANDTLTAMLDLQSADLFDVTTMAEAGARRVRNGEAID